MSGNEKTLDMIFGRWRSQILYTGVKLGVFDCVNSIPKNASEIAKQLGLSLYSILDWMLGIFTMFLFFKTSLSPKI